MRGGHACFSCWGRNAKNGTSAQLHQIRIRGATEREKESRERQMGEGEREKQAKLTDSDKEASVMV